MTATFYFSTVKVARLNMLRKVCCCKNIVSRKLATDSSIRWAKPAGFKTDIRVFNPISKEKEELVLRHEGIATWYSCGPTVYDSAHIGHASCYVKFDIIQRILRKWFNINVITCMSVTDIDDKIIKRANDRSEEHANIARFYELEFFNDLTSLNVIHPIFCTRVTDYVPAIIVFIRKIVDQGYAYTAADGSVYFKTSAYTSYGKLVPIVQSEVEKDEAKLSPSDFALWKAVKPGEPYWESPWGKGRPGWHIECSTMASAIFGSNIDIHSGGIDLKFPHHENEEAQSCAYHSCHQWINYWLHSGHLHFKGDEKMSKSLNNVLSISDLLNDYSADHFRMLCLLSSYRNNIEFSDDAMQTSVKLCKKIESFLGKCEAYIKGQYGNDKVIDEPALLKVLNETKEEIRSALCDDFNTPKAMASIINLISFLYRMFDSEKPAETSSVENQNNIVARSPLAVAAVYKFVFETLANWGLTFAGTKGESEIGEGYTAAGGRGNSALLLGNVLDTSVGFRNRVRHIVKSVTSEDIKKRKKELFGICDSFRDDMLSYGIEIQDHGTKSSWTLLNEAPEKSNVKRKTEVKINK